MARGHTLIEMRRIMGVLEKKPRQAFFHLKRVEEGSVLVVQEIHIEFLVPEDAAGGGDIHELEKEGVADQVVDERYGAAEPGIGPRRGVGIGDIEPGDRGVDDLVGSFRHRTLDLLLIWRGEDSHGNWTGRMGGCREAGEEEERGKARELRRAWEVWMGACARGRLEVVEVTAEPWAFSEPVICLSLLA